MFTQFAHSSEKQRENTVRVISTKVSVAKRNASSSKKQFKSTPKKLEELIKSITEHKTPYSLRALTLMLISQHNTML